MSRRATTFQWLPVLVALAASTAAFDVLSEPSPPRAPNILIVLLDDVGFSAASTFGGPVATPALDQLAARGLIYNNFHTTGMCSPTRAALLTGRNHHVTGMGVTPEAKEDRPGYDNHWGREAGSFVETLRRSGYSTAAFGKWHLTPMSETGPVGPFENWPTSRGFEYFYGFQGAQISQWYPKLFRNTSPIDPPKRAEEGYHLTTDLVDDAIGWLNAHESLATDRPWLLYMAPGATHTPHHVSREWIDRYRGRFEDGWDSMRKRIFTRQKALGVIPQDARLTPRPKELPAWSSMSADERRLLSREMEVFAGFLAHTDHEMGRLIDAVSAQPDADNTLIVYIVGDNGSSMDGNFTASMLAVPDLREALQHLDELGGPLHMNNYSPAWGWALNTPFPWGKQVASHLGAIRNPLVVAWGHRIPHDGKVRTQFHHVIDVAPTLLEAAHVEAPGVIDGVTQRPLDGISMGYSFGEPNAPSRRKSQYFAINGNRAYYEEGWWAGAWHRVPWDLMSPSRPFEDETWQLYQLDRDFSQSRNVAARFPERLAHMQRAFELEAKRNGAWPLSGRIVMSSKTPEVSRVDFYRGEPPLYQQLLPALRGHSFRLTTTIAPGPKPYAGVLLAAGDRRHGFAWFVKDNVLRYANNFGGRVDTLSATRPLPTDRSAMIEFRFDIDGGGGGTARFLMDGEDAGGGPIATFADVPFNEYLEVGRQSGVATTPEYVGPNEFTGSFTVIRLELESAESDRMGAGSAVEPGQ